ncbi:MAG: hemin uptake protein HemP [Pseudomonadota bacterium]
MSARTPEPAPGKRHDTRERNAPDTVSSRALFGNQRTLVIDHDGERYTLRITSNRKLILTK